MKPMRAQVSNCLDVSNKSSMLQETMIKQYICGTNSFSLRNHHRFALISHTLTARICSETRMERHITRAKRWRKKAAVSGAIECENHRASRRFSRAISRR